MPDNPPKRRGRPTTEPKAGEKATLNVRASPNLKRYLIEASDRADRSLSGEMEVRLEISRSADDLLSATLERLAGSKLNGVLAETLARIIGRHAEEARLAGRPSWLDDRDEHEILVRALVQAVRSLQPAGKLTLSEEQLAERVAPCMRPWFNTHLGLLAAAHQGGPQSVAAQFLKGSLSGAEGDVESPPEWPSELRPGRRVTFRVAVGAGDKDEDEDGAPAAQSPPDRLKK